MKVYRFRYTRTWKGLCVMTRWFIVRIYVPRPSFDILWRHE